MNGHPRQPAQTVPFSRWAHHRADNGLIYLSNPVTGDVKWLWSRHHDPNTDNDYLVNTITNKREWVTPQNEHLCPVKPSQPSQPRNASVVQRLARPVNNQSAATNPAPQLNSAGASAASTAPLRYREVEAPKWLALTADEVLCEAEGGRRYIHNKKTRNSRWLDPPPEKASEPSRSALSPQGQAPNAPERKERATFPTNSSTTNRPQSATAPEAQSWQAFSRQRNGSAHRPTEPQLQRTNNAYAQRQPVLSAEDAALTIQRAFRASLVRRENITGKLRLLTGVVANVTDLTSKGKYDMAYLRSLPSRNCSEQEQSQAAQRLLELGEYLTQQMLKVDAVESSGNQLVRARRKQSVKMILGLTDEVDALRRKLKS